MQLQSLLAIMHTIVINNNINDTQWAPNLRSGGPGTQTDNQGSSGLQLKTRVPGAP